MGYFQYILLFSNEASRFSALALILFCLLLHIPARDFETPPTMLLSVAVFVLTIVEAFAVSKGLSFPYLEGCGKALPDGQSTGVVSNVTIVSGGNQRNYLILIPPYYHSKIPTPAILSYHGGVRTAEQQLLLDQLTNPVFNNLSFVIYPQGINVSMPYKVSARINN